jgi:hypothetical protein
MGALAGRYAFHSEDEREVIATNVSTCGLQRQLSSNEVFEWPILHMRSITHNKTAQTRTFLNR